MLWYWIESLDDMSERRVARKGTDLDDSGSEGAEEPVVDCDQRLEGSWV